MKETERETALFSISNYAISPIQQYFLIVVEFELWFPIPHFDPILVVKVHSLQQPPFRRDLPRLRIFVRHGGVINYSNIAPRMS